MNRKNILVILAICSLMIGLAVSAHASTVAIASYDIQHTPESGWQGWYHTYNGTITSDGGGYYNYYGGSGTINDGVIGTSESEAHLFSIQASPVITLNLGGSYAINVSVRQSHLGTSFQISY